MRVNCLYIEEEALWAIYIEYKRITPNPRLGDMTILPLTQKCIILQKATKYIRDAFLLT